MTESVEEKPWPLRRADLILENLDLTWDDIANKKILDVGSAESAIAQAAKLKKSTAEVNSVDIRVTDVWKIFPWKEEAPPVQADAKQLPFADESFDYVLMHASVTRKEELIEGARVLKEGGELRIYPMIGMVLEYWYISKYLDEIVNMPRDKITNLLEAYDRQIEEADDWIPNEYVELRKKALNKLSKDQKLEVIQLMVHRYKQMTDLSFDYQVDDPDSLEPNAMLIYKKE